MLSRLKIGPKLLLAPAAVLVLLVLLAALAGGALLRQNQALAQVVEQRAARIKAAAELVAAVQRGHAEVYQWFAWTSASFSGARIETLARQIASRQRRVEAQFDALLVATREVGAERALVAQAAAAHARYGAAVADALDIARSDQSVGTAAMSRAERAFDEVAQGLAALAQREQDLSALAVARTRADLARVQWAMRAGVAAAVGLALLITMAVRRALLREVGSIGAAASALSSGNLTAQQGSDGRDEIADTARALDASIRHLNGTLKAILACARDIDGSSGQIAQMGRAIDGQPLSASHAQLVVATAAAAQRLQQQALGLSRAVAGLRLDQDGAPPRPPAGRARLRLAARRGKAVAEVEHL
ncbi:MAG: hypothetical protein V4582_06905 [Pseudomonadota bacterium]